MFDKLKEECGIIGICLNKESEQIIKDLYLGLFALQHRGQESCGISFIKNNKIEVIKKNGLVSSELFESLPFEEKSIAGIGHVRYSTCGESNLVNAQPLVFRFNKGEIAIAHNGNIPNSELIKEDLIKSGSIFQTTSDSEILAHLMARIPDTNFEKSLILSLRQLQGAYSILMLYDNSLIAFRDPFGFRPLSYGKIKDGYAFASETNALDLLGAKDITDVEPGEIIFCKNGTIEKKRFTDNTIIRQCIFELIYFARPDSIVFGESVHEVRMKMGARLSKLNKYRIDIVIPVPDSGNSAALGFSRESGIPFEFGLIRNHYTGRTFIKPQQKKRVEGVKIKLNPLQSVIKDKSLAVIDDSLVRGTTSSKIVQMLKDSGAKEVHLFLSSPEIKKSCFFGIDTPTEKELISSNMPPEEIAKFIKADSVTFLPLNDLKLSVKFPEKYCYACFNGDYPIKIKKNCLNGYCKN
ncbi:MAG TPA: amidophosphoribosyltransferase [Spirochaetota bacterium]|nr:amidophosphoribosyltransferase [Spirochaetota bacterium]HOL57444.1 amidophosphoribosyltransferase [Spirochaetota bacterium]HPP05295.1 amidophosphoribosyltransferase [Spirochaetota bacterium]